MSLHARWKRIVRVSAVVLAVLLAGFAAYVPIQQRILRWRAERLLTDIREIQMGKSTWADAQRLMTRWGSWGDRLTTCTEKSCIFRISIDDSSHALDRFPVLHGGNWGTHLWWPHWMNKPYFWLGGRFAVVVAEFSLKDGIIQTKSFGMLTAPSSGIHDVEILDFRPHSVVLARAVCHQQLSHWGFFSADHPEFSFDVIDDKQSGHGVSIEFTPYADEKTVSTFLSFNLDCLSQFKECKTAKEANPAAIGLLQSDTKAASRRHQESAYRNQPIWVIARDAEFVAIGEVGKIAEKDRFMRGKTPVWVQTKLLLKGENSVGVTDSYEAIKTEGSKNLCLLSSKEINTFPEGAQILMFFDGLLNRESAKKSDFYPCLVTSLSDQNLAEVHRGIVRGSVLNAPNEP